MLTTKEINKLKPIDKIYRKYDHNGMYLQVQPNGSKYWRMQYKINGKEKVYSIGIYQKKTKVKVNSNPNKQSKTLTIIGLKDARFIRDSIRVQIAKGIDPNAEKLKKKRITQGFKTFEVVARQWHSKVCIKWSDKHSKEVISSLERDIFPFIGNMQIDEIKPPKMLEIFERIEKRGALVILRKVIQRCERIFKYGITRELCFGVPMAYSKDTFESREKENYPYFKHTDLYDYFKKLDKYKGELTTILGLKFTLLTMTRTSEVRFATWDEVDFKKKIWVIPAIRMKMKNTHVVPLSKQALDILKQLKEFNGAFKYVFASYHKPQIQPMSENAMLFALYKMGYKGKATVHGMRATASTALNELQFNRDWVEKQLSHLSKNDIRDSYNHAEYIPLRTKMMQFWADYLDGLKEGIEITVKDWEESH